MHIVESIAWIVVLLIVTLPIQVLMVYCFAKAARAGYLRANKLYRKDASFREEEYDE